MKRAVTSILFGLLASAAMSQGWNDGSGNVIKGPDNRPEINFPDDYFTPPGLEKRSVMPGDNVQTNDNASEVAKKILQAKKAFTHGKPFGD